VIHVPAFSILLAEKKSERTNIQRLYDIQKLKAVDLQMLRYFMSEEKISKTIHGHSSPFNYCTFVNY